MFRLRSIVVLLAVLVAALVVAAPAEARPTIGTVCAHPVAQTNDWQFFFSKKIRATTSVCRTDRSFGPSLDYAKPPIITYPSALPIPSAEKVTTTHGVYFYNKFYNGKYLYRAVYRWDAQSCTVICTNWTFSFAVDSIKGTQLCAVGGSCDAWKHW